jgi:hypothetical protein
MPNPEQDRLIARYAEGPDRLEAALNLVPAEALKWRPGPGKWSVHQVIVHCADSETNSHMRVRYLLGEESPTIIGYDQDRWADVMDYESHPLVPALATVRAVRANTGPLLRRLTPAQWARRGTHTESGSFGVKEWLEVYAEHLHQHEKQILRNLETWKKREQ